MNYTRLKTAGLDYFPCRYGASRQLFRGPRRRLNRDYVVFLGGTETYGKFLDMPYPTLVEHETGLTSVNLGCVNAGIDVYSGDRNLLDICNRARVTVVQVMGAQNMSNRYYAVHSRRNDRFLRASPLLQMIYPEVDFTDFTFTRHLLARLEQVSAQRFTVIRAELKEAWLARMRTLLSQIDGCCVLLWLADRAPPPPEQATSARDPLFVDSAMLAALSDLVQETVPVIGTGEERRAGLEEMFFADAERPVAEAMLGPLVHRRAAATLAPVLRALT
jgi:hypothetical protein